MQLFRKKSANSSQRFFMKQTDKKEWERLKQVLDDKHSYPTNFLFKFIIPETKKTEFDSLFPHFKQLGYQTKPSSGGKYISITITLTVSTSEEILRIYTIAQQIEGLIAL